LIITIDHLFAGLLIKNLIVLRFVVTCVLVILIGCSKKRSIYYHVNSGGSFGASPLRKEIGLGGAESIDLLEIHWPTSGITQTFTVVKVDSCLQIREEEEQ